MTTVFQFKSLKFKVYANDHNPPHVHVIGMGCEAVFNLWTLELMHDTDFHGSDIRVIKRLIKTNQAKLLESWNG